MGNRYPEITSKQRALLEDAALFFVASVAPDLSRAPSDVGPVNVSPKGGTGLVVVSPTQVAYLDYPGSGNETARHAEAGGPLTLMALSFSEDAAIVRLYGRARVEPLEGSPLAERLLTRAAPELAKRPRQVVVVDVDETQTSCGYGVPRFEYLGERTREQRGRAYKEPKPS